MNVLSTRLTKWCDALNVIDEAQAGFRKKYSTIDNAFTLMSLGQKYISKKKGRFYCIFIDFVKAFDSYGMHSLEKILIVNFLICFSLLILS